MKREFLLPALLALCMPALAAADPPDDDKAIPVVSVDLILQRMDRDNDGKVSFEEYRNAMTRRFHKVDANGDGLLEQNEVPKEWLAVGAKDLANGRIGAQEFASGLRPAFDGFDLDRDSALNNEELASFARAGSQVEGNAMNASRLFLAFSSVALASAFALQAKAETTVTCESRNGSYQSCPVDTRGGVVLSHQLSSQGCWQNDTWGYDRNRIWVNNGCRAQFEVGGRSSSGNKDNAVAAAVVVGLVGAAILASNKNKRDHDNDDDYQPDNWGGPRTTFECESRDNDFSYCGNGRVRGHVEIYRQLSRSACVFGQSWGMDRGQVWVDKGCRAEFAVY